MHPDLVLFRTPKGEEIIQGTGHEISTIQRRALLVVDGKTSVAKLVEKAIWVKDLAALLQELVDMGLVHDAVSAGHEAGVQSGETLQHLKIQLVATARELLGSNAERVVKKIEDTASTPEALEEALLSCKKIIKLTINEELADTFLRRGREIIGK